MSNSISEKKREYLRIASRFLKEVGLYGLWIKYCYSPKTCMNWVIKDDNQLEITDILGNTSFTAFVKRFSKTKGKYFGYMCVYEVFGEYVRAMHLEYKEKVHDYTINRLSIDLEKKKIELK